MKKQKNKSDRDRKINYSLFSFRQFISIFGIFAFVITVSFLLFFNNNLVWIFNNVELEYSVQERALQNFLNVIFLSVVISIIYNIIKNITIKKPVIKILEATKRITEGDFSARIENESPLGIFNEFDLIIEDFNKMASELAGTETLKSDFIANVSHEIKTPLSVIQNYSTMLRNPELTQEERMEYTDILIKASSKISELVTGVLRLSKIENQQIFSEKTTFNLGESICECMLDFESRWEEKKLEIETDIEEDLIINADKELLSFIWSNLISNAVKFTPEGGKVSLKVFSEGDKITVQVSDTGIGISEEEKKRIFEKFYQADKSRTTGGNGLGLALVKKIADITGSRIEVESEKGKGSVFTVVINR